MTAQKSKNQSNKTTYFFMIIIGLLGIIICLIKGVNLNSILSVIKLILSIVIFTFGLWNILKKDKE